MSEQIPYPGIIYPGNVYPTPTPSYEDDGRRWDLVVPESADAAGALAAYGQSQFSFTVDSEPGGFHPLSVAGVDRAYRGPYFDGNEGAGGFHTEWEGTPERSNTALRAATVPGVNYSASGTVIPSLDVLWASSGTQSLRLVPTSIEGMSPHVALALPAVDDGTYTIRATFNVEGPISGRPSIRVGSWEGFAPQTPGVHEVFVTFTKSAAITSFSLNHGGVWSDGDVYVDDLAIQAGSRKDFYWGEDEDHIDFAHLWEGAENNSPTLKRALRSVSNVYPYNSHAVQASSWRQNGYYSLRIVNTSSTLPGRVKIVDIGDLTPGKTYTIMGVVRSDDPLPGTGFPYKSLTFEAGDFRVDASSTVREGADRLIVSFVVPSGVVDGGVFLYNGGVQGDPDVWWDSVVVMDGVERIAYFDGDRRGHEWLGVPHASVTRRIPVPFKSGGWPLKKFYASMADILGEVDELIARFTYFSKDERDQIPFFGYTFPGREVPLGETSDLVDPRTADEEWLHWIGTMTGVKVENYTDSDELRRAVMEADSGYKAGSRESMIASVKTVLSGPWDGREVRIIPNTSSMDAIGQASTWDLMIVTRTTVSPSSATLLAAIERSGSKPAGIKLHHTTFEATWEDVEAAFPTWGHWEGKTWLQIEDAGFQ